MRKLGAVLFLAALNIACQSTSRSEITSPSPTPTKYSALVVFTTWTPDSKVLNGPEPGYKPALSGLTGHDIVNASPLIDSTGTTWLVQVWFSARGADLFAQLTRNNVRACQGDPNTSAASNSPQRHLGIWLDLTQADIDSWEEANRTASVSMQFDLACLAQAGAPVCPKFVSDPITLQEIDGGTAVIAGGFTQASAMQFAAAITAPAR